MPRSTTSATGAEIYRRSFAIIRAEADLSALPGHRRARRGAHDPRLRHDRPARRRGDVGGFRASRRGGPDGAARRSCATSKMVANGITRARLPADNEVICTLDDPRVPELAARWRTTRSAAAMELWREHLAGRDRGDRQRARPPCSACSRCSTRARPGRPPSIGIPVGFVGAAESKEALAARRPRALRRGPWTARRQRHGGGGRQRARERR